MMLFDKYINREVDRRMHEQNIQREMWDRMDRMQKQIEDLRFQVECLRPCNVPDTEVRDG